MVDIETVVAGDVTTAGMFLFYEILATIAGLIVVFIVATILLIFLKNKIMGNLFKF